MLNFTQFLSLSRFPFSIQIYANGTQNKTGSIRAVQKQIHRELACKRSRAWISSPFVVANCLQTSTAASLYAYKMHGFVIQKYRKQFFPLKKKNKHIVHHRWKIATQFPSNRECEQKIHETEVIFSTLAWQMLTIHDKNPFHMRVSTCNE